MKGILLGISMVLPGISGGTTVFILGIYEKLIDEIAKFNFQQVQNFLNLFTFKKEKFFKNIFLLINPYDWAFLIPLFVGFVFAIILFALIAPPFIEKYFIEFYFLVFGLIVVSLYSPFKEMQKNLKTFFLLALSFCINFLFFYGFEGVSIVQREIASLLFLPTGFLVAMTLIIPGISGAYVLILLGLYQTTLETLRDFNFIDISFFLMGIVMGFIIMVRFVQLILKKYFNESLAVILGLILGSLYGLWSFLEKSLGGQIHFETLNGRIFFYLFAPFLIVIGYKFYMDLLKKNW